MQNDSSKLNTIEFRRATFDTVTDALDYAARGSNGLFFYSSRARLEFSLSYSDLQIRAKNIAARLCCITEPNDRVGLIAETSPDFAIMFFACQYAGVLPVPISMPTSLGGKDIYKDQIRRIGKTAGLNLLLAPSSMLSLVSEAMANSKVRIGELSGASLPPRNADLRPFGKDDNCYVQFSSGSTSSPKGILGSQQSVTANCRAIMTRLEATSEDRVCSWLPLYHDMGLIGHFITPLMCQLSIDYLSPQSFARLPSSWLKIISENKATFSYSPSFGYEICAKRWREAFDLDLSHWRVAGIGGDMVRKEALDLFTNTFSSHGFSSKAYVASYGLAESTLAVSFNSPGTGINSDLVDAQVMGETQEASSASETTKPYQRRTFVSCGNALPELEIKVCDEDGVPLIDRQVGRILVRGSSVSPGILDENRGVVPLTDENGWLDTGDLGYWLDGEIVITGRHKDLILFNGRNIWPQDIEWTAEKVGGPQISRSAAFELDDQNGENKIYLLAECRSRDSEVRNELVSEITSSVRQLVGAPVSVHLVPNRSLIMTSSGKLSRMRTRNEFKAGKFPTDTPAVETVAN